MLSPIKPEDICKYRSIPNKASEIVQNQTSQYLYTKYTGEGLRGSSELNMALIEYFYTGLPFYNNSLYERAKILIEAFNKVPTSTPTSTDTFTVYHGTDYKLHSSSNKFTTYAFFSTTTYAAIAKSYCKNQESYLYRIEIPNNFPYINLEDTCNLQILLPIGTKIIDIMFVGKLQNGTWTPNVINSGKQFSDFLPSMDADTQKVYNCYTATINPENIKDVLKNVKLLIDSYSLQPLKKLSKNDSIVNITDFTCIKLYPQYRGSSTIYHGFYATQNSLYGPSRRKRVDKSQKTEYIIKDIIKKRDMIKQLKTENQDYICRRLMNETLASLVYEYVFGCKTLEYTLLQGKIEQSSGVEYFLASKKLSNIDYCITNQDKAQKILSGFLIDCIMSNWDAYNNKNIGILEGKTIRTDVGGALAYRGIGDFKLSFFNHLDPNDHITFLTDTKNKSGNFLKRCFDLLPEDDKKKENNFKILISSCLTQDTIYIEQEINKLISMQQYLGDDSLKRTNISVFLPVYKGFIDQILQTVIRRYYWYQRNIDTVAEAVYVLIIQPQVHQIPPPIGGGKDPKHKYHKYHKDKIIYQGKTRKVHVNNGIRYIIYNKSPVRLDTIKGKYKKQKAGAAAAQECTRNPEYDIDTTGNHLRLECIIKKRLAELQKKPKSSP